MNITLSINDDIPFALNESAEEFAQDLRFLAAVMWYRRGKLSLGKAAELAGYTKLDFIERMQREQEPIFDYGAAEMAAVFADVAKLP